MSTASVPDHSGRVSGFFNFKPLRDRVLVKRIRKELPLIVVPGVNDKPSQECEVIAVGPGKRDKDGHLTPTQVKPGQRVLVTDSINMGYSDILRDEADDHVLIQEADIVGVVG